MSHAVRRAPHGGEKASAAPAARWGGRRFNESAFRKAVPGLLEELRSAPDVEAARRAATHYVNAHQLISTADRRDVPHAQLVRIRDCARALRAVLSAYGDGRTGFSVAQALWDLSRRVRRPDLREGFFAEMIQLFLGVEGRTPVPRLRDVRLAPELAGREAALRRSAYLDRLAETADARMATYAHGLQEEVIRARARRRDQLLEIFDATVEDWGDWRWHVRHIVRDPDVLARAIRIPGTLRAAIVEARAHRLPFAVTPFYLSLMDEQEGPDRALRAQVLPPPSYVQGMVRAREHPDGTLDFMREGDTSPVPLVTRRYPSIAIIKPYNTCPQICVYCQRNWEIQDAMAPGSLASEEDLDRAVGWIRAHPSIHEVLVTGGDPLAMGDGRLRTLLDRLCAIPALDRVRIGTRTLVTLPCRFTEPLVELLGSYRRPGYREIAVVTHVQHPYELNLDLVHAVDRLRRAGIPVYNQLVYTFHVSRRFEATLLRRLLRRAGIDPYYTFSAKGKEETAEYRVPVARLLQEQKEEARILPGLARTDECVVNVPGLGKNHLRALQHRDLLGIRADGARLYEFHPWEKNIALQSSYVAEDVPILTYLRRLADLGERPEEYESIWHYY